MLIPEIRLLASFSLASIGILVGLAYIVWRQPIPVVTDDTSGEYEANRKWRDTIIRGVMSSAITLTMFLILYYALSSSSSTLVATFSSVGGIAVFANLIYFSRRRYAARAADSA
jgi:zinc transporter ZupT